MIKATVLIATAFALGAQAAIAGPLTVSDRGEKPAQKSEISLVSSVMNQLKISISNIRSTAGGSAGKSTKHKSSAPKQCEYAENAHDEENQSEAKKGDPVGPEPIYIGF